MTAEPNYYELLGVDQNATQAEIKTAFRENALRNHPDHGGSSALFRVLEDAYSTLTSPSKREEYDVWLASVGPGTPPGGVQIPTDIYDESTNDRSTWADEAASFVDREPQEDVAPVFVAATGPPLGTPKLKLSNSGTRNWRPKLRYLLAVFLLWKIAVFAWLVIALASGRNVIPGVPNDAVVFGLIFVILVWLFTSIALRVGGWAFAIYAVLNADNVTPLVTGAQLVIGVALWLAGQWFFTFRHGKWHSLIAYGVMRRLPGWLRPDRRFQVGLP